MIDETEEYRRARAAEINVLAAVREDLERQYGRIWSTEEVRDQFEVLSFAAPYVIVRRKRDGLKGSLEFQHAPRFYWGWLADD